MNANRSWLARGEVGQSAGEIPPRSLSDVIFIFHFSFFILAPRFPTATIGASQSETAVESSLVLPLRLLSSLVGSLAVFGEISPPYPTPTPTTPFLPRLP